MKQPRLLRSFGLPRRLLKPTIALALALGVAWAGHFAYRLWQLKTLFEPHIIAYNFRNMSRLLCTSGEPCELDARPQALPEGFNFTGKTIAIS